MKALIFNSGLGKRLKELTKDNHKSLVKLLNGETIFERQIRILSECGIKDFIVTVGHAKELVIKISQRFPHLNFIFMDNEKYASTNYIYSMYLASSYLDKEMLILHGDLVFNRKLVMDILENTTPSLCLINEEKPLPKKDFKARVQGDYLKEVSVDILGDDCHAFQPFYKLAKEDVLAWKNEVNSFIKSGNDQVYAEDALNRILDKLKITAISYKDDYIDEIDDELDYQRVAEEVKYFDFREQQIYNVDAQNSNEKYLKEVFAKNNIKKILLVGSEKRSQELIRLLHQESYQYVHFSGFSSNPKYKEVKKGIDLFAKANCDFIISIGGGSAIDVAKAIKILASADKELDFLEGKYNYSPIKHLTIPTTAGSGSESTRFAVVYYQGEKVSINHDSLLPDYVILDYRYLKSLPDYFKKSTMLDALCQAIESFWARKATCETKDYSRDAIRLILENYKEFLDSDNEALKSIMMASNLAGKAINITTTTAPHAMSYKMTSMYGISHGHAVALSLPVVWRFMLENLNQSEQKDQLEAVFIEIADAFNCETIDDAIYCFEKLCKELDLLAPVVASKEDISILVDSINVERLSNHPLMFHLGDLHYIYSSFLIT